MFGIQISKKKWNNFFPFPKYLPNKNGSFSWI